MRFSAGTGLPDIPDVAPEGMPKGCALRFHLGPHQHTDIIAHSLNLFPARNAEELLTFFRALRAGGDAVPAFLADHPAAVKFVTAPKPIPESFARLAYFAVNAFRLVGADGSKTTVRYRIVPAAGLASIDDEQAKSLGPNYLMDEIKERMAPGAAGATFTLQAQVAEPGDPSDDPTVVWPDDRKMVDLGTVTLDKVLPTDGADQKRIIYDPIPRVDGVEPSDDAMLQVRGDTYLMSGRKRREASKV